MQRLLLVEDDEQLREVTSAFLTLSGYDVHTAATAEACWTALQEKSFQLIILDLGLPDEDGLVLLRKISSSGSGIPIIVSSGRGTDEDRITGLEMGASDYLAKPYKVKELLLRIGLLTRDKPVATIEKVITRIGNMTIDHEHELLLDENNDEIALTAQERSVLWLLADNAPRVYSREKIIDATRLGDGPESVRAVDTIISRLRKKLDRHSQKPSVIKTVQGMGYRVNLN